MNRREEKARSGLKIKGSLVENGVRVTEKQDVSELSSRGYGLTENGGFMFTFYEALFLLDKEILEIRNEKNKKVDFHTLLEHFKCTDKNAWARYLAYRDLRSRGYVVREGFGLDVDFRLYERGEYGEETAKYLILSVQEGKPIPLSDLTRVLRQCQSLKKQLILAVMNRRGEIVYYSVSQLNMK